MSPQSWFEPLRGRAAKKKLIRPQVRSRYLPLLERLEDRTVLDAVNWINAAGGDWDTAANWVDTADNSHHVPGATDDVTINVAGNVTITHNQNVTDAINSLSATDIVQLNAGTLNVAAALEQHQQFSDARRYAWKRDRASRHYNYRDNLRRNVERRDARRHVGFDDGQQRSCERHRRADTGQRRRPGNRQQHGDCTGTLVSTAAIRRWAGLAASSSAAACQYTLDRPKFRHRT